MGSEVDVEVLDLIVDVKGVVRHQAVIVTMTFGPNSFTVHGCKSAIHIYQLLLLVFINLGVFFASYLFVYCRRKLY